MSAVAQSSAPSPSSPESRIPDRGIDKTGVFVDSLALLGIEHGIRLAFQPGTRRELRGNFWRDYYRSVRVPTAWEDTDSWLVNYVGHPIQGAAAGYLWIDHDPAAPSPAEGLGGSYWASRARATAWSAVYSLQFEFGPLSEASIGNVGLHRNTTGWTDHIVTPLGGLAFIVAEDMADRHLLAWLEPRIGSRSLRNIVRVALTPSRALANMAEGRMPWFRPNPLR